MADTHPPESPDALLRRSLNAGARAALERRLGAAAAEDAALARLLARLPDRPVASNFNARVLALLDRPEAAPVPAPWWQALLRPRVAAAAGPQALRLADGPVLNLNLPAPGAMAEARPDVTPVLERGEISEPEPVVLPEAQTARVG